MSSEAQHTVPEAMKFLHRKISESTDNEIFRAIKTKKIMNIDHGTTRYEVVRLGVTSPNAAGSLPNIQYQITLGDVTKNLYAPWVSYPSETDASLHKAVFLLCFKYIE